MPRQDEVARIIALFRERSAYWTSKGYHDAELYEQLAIDPKLPENLPGQVIAALEGVQPSAVAQRRKRGAGSGFLRTAQNMVIYPTANYCRYLGRSYSSVFDVSD